MERQILHIAMKYKKYNIWIKATAKISDVRKRAVRLKK